MKLLLDKADREKLAKTVAQWRLALDPSDEERRGPFAMLKRADRAQLRRCAAPEDVLLQSAFHRLLQELKRQGVAVEADELALAAGVAAHAQHAPGKAFARSLGRKNDVGRVAMSELRFHQLQTCRDEDGFFRQTRRAVDLLGGEVDVGKLAVELLQWVREFRHPDAALAPKERLKLRWAADYYHESLREADQEPA
ncbi:type I-E CRISPR-associated protein Cse2/CasB [Chromobacterium vaccinii]|uniref:Type I-E CRISPR-associated protein Cse2/CasB n=1 Tax=Chromobacterium vaccinii TaxID=1108595 RepID=A0A1D9LL41_9NEIS|nr:type I-E CRISPR-associated protein Cse2/CasB [Chromobacterium vaccinii]AOZ52028.1 type I-E CRISPR-associated protein Cse2/CasB [Chromobacterium vaccinii]